MKLYNGAPCSKLRAHMDAMSELRKELNLKATMLVEKGASVTYFPMEGQWLGFVGHKSVTSFYDSEADCICATIKYLEDFHDGEQNKSRENSRL